jgi:hypothetical protein
VLDGVGGAEEAAFAGDPDADLVGVRVLGDLDRLVRRDDQDAGDLVGLVRERTSRLPARAGRSARRPRAVTAPPSGVRSVGRPRRTTSSSSLA